MPPLFPDGSGGNCTEAKTEVAGAFASEPKIKADTFYGKPQQTAVRELLKMRKAAGEGPAKPNQILEGLRAGGYQVEAKTDHIALVGLRAMLRKRTAIFHKLPNGTWGLREWYPNLKAQKEPSSGKTIDENEVPELKENEAETAVKKVSAA